MADDWKTDVSGPRVTTMTVRAHRRRSVRAALTRGAEALRPDDETRGQEAKRRFQGRRRRRDDDDAKYDNPKRLAKMAKRSKKKDPGLMGNLIESFGGALGGATGSGGGKGANKSRR